jgi:hypothetical protein
LITSNCFALTVKLTSLQSGQRWYLRNVYGPCTPTGKPEFTNWLYNIDASAYDLWMWTSDFNLIHCLDNRNRLGGNTSDMMLFNDLINHLNLVEVSLKNRAFTWSNMQQKTLLVKLDWVLTSSNWTASFPNTLAYAISHAVSDHLSYVVQKESMVP